MTGAKPRPDPLHNVAPCVALLCKALDRRDLPLLAAQLGPQARWTIVGRPDRFAFGGSRHRAEMIDSITASLSGFRDFTFEIVAAAQAGDIAFVEAIAHGAGPGDAIYHNRYLIRFRLDDGLISDVLEHYDPFEALAYVEQIST